MSFQIPVDFVRKEEIVVEDKDSAKNYGSGLVDVYATPAMVGLMEGCAQRSLIEFLPENMVTVGAEINTKHLKATPIGMKVRVESKITAVEGKKIVFFIEAFDELDKIGEATHIRFVVDQAKFMQRTLQKAEIAKANKI